MTGDLLTQLTGEKSCNKKREDQPVREGFWQCLLAESRLLFFWKAACCVAITNQWKMRASILGSIVFDRCPRTLLR